MLLLKHAGAAKIVAQGRGLKGLGTHRLPKATFLTHESSEVYERLAAELSIFAMESRASLLSKVMASFDPLQCEPLSRSTPPITHDISPALQWRVLLVRI